MVIFFIILTISLKEIYIYFWPLHLYIVRTVESETGNYAMREAGTGVENDQELGLELR